MLIIKTELDADDPLIYCYRVCEKSVYLMTKPNNESSSSATNNPTLGEPFKFLSYNFDEELIIDSIYTSDESATSDSLLITTEEQRDYQHVSCNLNNTYNTSLNEEFIQDFVDRQIKEVFSSTKLSYVEEESLANELGSSVFIRDENEINNENNTMIYDEKDSLPPHVRYFETEIIKNDTICIQHNTMDNYENLVESPYNKREEIHHHKNKPSLVSVATASGLNVSSNKTNLTKSNLIDYINSLRQIETSTAIQDTDSDAETSSGSVKFKYKPNANDKSADAKIKNLRNKLYSFLLDNLETIIKSDEILTEFRDCFIQFLRKHEQNESFNVEQFAQEAFEFFNGRLFCKLLSSVNIEWSHRLKS